MGNKTGKPVFIEQKSREFSQMENTLVQDHFATPTFVPLDFLKAITSDFSKEQELGRGGFGVVYKGLLKNGKAIAVKKLSTIMNLHGDQFCNEIVCLSRAKHKNIVRLIGYCDESRGRSIKYNGEHVIAEFRERLLCYECINNNSLDKHLSAETHGLEWHMRYEIIKGICHGLHYLHTECQIVHLDLKPENILLDDNMEPKITDFGMCRRLGLEESKIITPTLGGTLGYMAPEYILDGLISVKADIFSLGVVIIEVVTGGRNYPSCEESFEQFVVDMVGRWRKRLEQEAGMYIPLEKYVEQVKECVLIGLSCVDADPKKRPKTSDIIEKLTKVDAANTATRSYFGWFHRTIIIRMLKQALKIQDVSRLEQLQAKEVLRELHRIGTNATRNRSFLQRFHTGITTAILRMVVLFLALENMHGKNNARLVQHKASSEVSNRSRNSELGVPKPKLSKLHNTAPVRVSALWLAAGIGFLCGLTLGEMRGLRRARVTNARDANVLSTCDRGAA